MSRVVGWECGIIFRRLSASEPMSTAGRSNGSDSCSKSGELRGRGVAKNVGPQAMLKTTLLGKKKT